MTRTRRCVLLLVLTVSVVLGASLPANALFSATAQPARQPAFGTLTVSGPGSVQVATSCETTTVVTKHTYRIDRSGNAVQTDYGRWTSTADSDRNVESDTTVRTEEPNGYTLTRTVKDTTLHATATWNRSSTPGVTGYRMTVFLADGTTHPMGDAPASSTSLSRSYDAAVVDRQARLSMVTLTSYGWTAPGALSNVTC